MAKTTRRALRGTREWEKEVTRETLVERALQLVAVRLLEAAGVFPVPMASRGPGGPGVPVVPPGRGLSSPSAAVRKMPGGPPSLTRSRRPRGATPWRDALRLRGGRLRPGSLLSGGHLQREEPQRKEELPQSAGHREREETRLIRHQGSQGGPSLSGHGHKSGLPFQMQCRCQANGSTGFLTASLQQSTS